MKEITFAVWDASEEELQLANNIKDYFISLFDEEVNVNIDDLKRIGETTYKTICIVFGTTAKNYINSEIQWMMPPLSSMIPSHKDYVKNKTVVAKVLKGLVEDIKNQKEEIPVTTHVETPEGVTVGREGFDINITEQEAEHLKNIKNILGGGKMVIIKGDIRIEVS